jgi:hypothetical protein
MIPRRTLLKAAGLAAAATIIRPAFADGEFDSLYAKARKEGGLNLYGGGPADWYTQWAVLRPRDANILHDEIRFAWSGQIRIKTVDPARSSEERFYAEFNLGRQRHLANRDAIDSTVAPDELIERLGMDLNAIASFLRESHEQAIGAALKRYCDGRSQ